MRELNLSEQYALIALEGQESLHRSVAKRCGASCGHGSGSADAGFGKRRMFFI